jgi:hypothetical protein
MQEYVSQSCETHVGDGLGVGRMIPKAAIQRLSRMEDVFF